MSNRMSADGGLVIELEVRVNSPMLAAQLCIVIR